MIDRNFSVNQSDEAEALPIEHVSDEAEDADGGVRTGRQGELRYMGLVLLVLLLALIFAGLGPAPSAVDCCRRAARDLDCRVPRLWCRAQLVSSPEKIGNAVRPSTVIDSAAADSRRRSDRSAAFEIGDHATVGYGTSIQVRVIRREGEPVTLVLRGELDITSMGQFEQVLAEIMVGPSGAAVRPD